MSTFTYVQSAGRLVLHVKREAMGPIVQLDIEPPDTEAGMRPKTVAVAKAAAAKLR